VGRQFFQAAELAYGHEYWNAAGVLYVHAAIAFADAVSILWGGLKSTGDDHRDAVQLLGEVMAYAQGRQEALWHLETLIREKNRIAFTGLSFRQKELEFFSKEADRFRLWCERYLKR
jgi:hypothetical protein